MVKIQTLGTLLIGFISFDKGDRATSSHTKWALHSSQTEAISSICQEPGTIKKFMGVVVIIEAHDIRT